ncbi:hypothetical protein HQ489_04025 [Candidatus Woesearchaeota archaeon]|nr:hypothetical protein [Candidatus Woesearchaeota archaeon]
MKGTAWKKKKTYGEYKVATCPFCERIATQKNEQGLEVCHQHTASKMEEIKCTCGKWLEQRVGKFGPYFNCMDCGNMNYNKAMEIKAVTKTDQPKPSSTQFQAPPVKKQTYVEKREPKVTYITSNDVEYFD